MKQLTNNFHVDVLQGPKAKTITVYFNLIFVLPKSLQIYENHDDGQKMYFSNIRVVGIPSILS